MWRVRVALMVLAAACGPGPTASDTLEDTAPGSDSGTSADTDADSDSDADTEDNGFACDELTCAGDEVCVVMIGGAPPPEGEDGRHPSCQPAPAACDAAPSCACVSGEDACPSFAECDDTTGGVVCTVSTP